MTLATRSRLRSMPAAAALLSILASLASSDPGPVAAAPAPAAAKSPAEAAKAAPPEGAAPAATATLPLGEYEKLAARPSVTVVDTLRVTGSFAGRDLSLVVIGRAAGVLPQVDLLSGSSTLRLYGCEGDAILSRSAGGVFGLLPQSGRFMLRCRIAVPGTDSLQLQLAPSVLWAESAVQDGELVRLEDAKEREGWRELSIVRTVETGAGEPLQPSLTARYHLMLVPEATEFLYRFEVRNPNRAYLELTLPLSPGEQVQRVDTTASYELGPGAVKVKLPPGEVTVQLHGSLRGERFTPKVAASVQYVLVDSHPLLRPVITTTAQRISVTETGLGPRFSYSQAFLFSKGPGGPEQALSWQVHKLEALRTTSFAVNTARHVFFLASDGAVLGETALVLSNQGAPALTLRSRAEPTFASLQDAPVLLTKDEAGALFLPLGQGRQDVLVQHRQALRRAAGFAWGTLHLPDPGIPASQGVVELRYEQKWQPLFESMPPEPRFPSLGIGLLLGLLLLFVVTERLLAAFAVQRGARIAAAVLLTGAAYSSGLWLGLLLGAELGLALLLLVPWVLEHRPSFWTVVGGLAVGGTLCLILASMLLVRGASSPRGSEALIESRYEAKEPRKAEPPGSPVAGEAPAYQGLPAKIVMPGGHDHSYLSREMLSAEHHGVFVLLLSRPLVALAGNLMLGLALILLALNLQALRSSLRGRWQRIFSPRPEQAP